MTKIDCKFVHIIGARGSGEEYGAKLKSVRMFFAKMQSRIEGKVSFSTYELGSSEGYKGHSYPAVKVNENETFGNGLGAMLSGGYAFKYGESVKEGILELRAYMNDVANSCPDARFVLMGYSQGAQLIGQALFWDLSKDIKDKILFVSLFGDPKLYLPEGEGLNPPACRGEQFSNWRRTVPDCRTNSGSLDARKPYITQDMQDKVGLWCNDNDWICGSSKWPLRNSGHEQYTDEYGPINDAAREATIKVNKHFKSSGNVAFKNGIVFLSKLDRPREGQDVILILDRTADSEITYNFRIRSMLSLAEKQWDLGGRFGLVTLCPNTSDPRRSNNVINFLERGPNPQYGYMTGLEVFDMLKVNYSYCGTIRPSSYNYAATVTVAIDAPRWRNGVEKAIIFPSTYDVSNVSDPTLLNYIKKRAIEIDPVNIYTVSPSGSPAGLFEDISDATGGRSITYNEAQTTAEQATQQASDIVVNRPIVRSSLGSFSAEIGKPVVLSVWSSLDEVDDHITYRWDYNADGVWDNTTTQPFGVTTFSSTGDKLVHVEVTGSDGSRASTVVPVTVGQPQIEQDTADLTPPSDVHYTVLETKDGKSTIRLEWKPFSTAYRYMLSIDGIHEGWLDNTRTSIDLRDIDRTQEVMIGLQAYDQNLLFGNRVNVVVPVLPTKSLSVPQPLSDLPTEQKPQQSPESIRPSGILDLDADAPELTPFMRAQSRDKDGQAAPSNHDSIQWFLCATLLVLALLSLVYFYRQRSSGLHK